jgi:hypothetical protein
MYVCIHPDQWQLQWSPRRFPLPEAMDEELSNNEAHHDPARQNAETESGSSTLAIDRHMSLYACTEK